MKQKGSDNKKTNRREPHLEEFIDFFDDETQLASDPLFSREAIRDYTKKPDKVRKNNRRLKQYVGKTKVEEKSGDAKDGDSEFKKVQFQFVMKAMILTSAECSRIKYLTREVKYYGKKSYAMEVIHQYHKVTMKNHINREERARSVSSLIQQVYMDIYQRKSNLR